MSENAASSRRTATRSLVLCALMAALTAICSQIQIPLPMVPINLALFAAHFAQIHRLFICRLIITVLRVSVNSVSPNPRPSRAACRRLTIFPVYAIIFSVPQK